MFLPFEIRIASLVSRILHMYISFHFQILSNSGKYALKCLKISLGSITVSIKSKYQLDHVFRSLGFGVKPQS